MIGLATEVGWGVSFQQAKVPVESSALSQASLTFCWILREASNYTHQLQSFPSPILSSMLWQRNLPNADMRYLCPIFHSRGLRGNTLRFCPRLQWGTQRPGSWCGGMKMWEWSGLNWHGMLCVHLQALTPHLVNNIFELDGHKLKQGSQCEIQRSRGWRVGVTG